MDQVLAFGSVLPAALGAGCCVAERRPDRTTVGAMLLMVLGMADTMLLGSVVLPTLAWAVVFAGLAIGLFLTRRGTELGRLRGWHLAATAVVTAVMAHPHGHGTPHDDAHGMSMAGMEHTAAEHHGQALVLLAVLVAVGYAGYVAVRAARSARWSAGGAGRWARMEVLAGAVSLLAMAGMAAAM